MKKINFTFVILTVAFIVSSCENAFEKALRVDVESRYEGIDVKYKNTSAEITDTITTSKRIDALLSEIGWLKNQCDTMSKDEFIRLRNQEFRDFRDSTYEFEIMQGSLKDASEWCTELRVRTEKADSILDIWDKLDKSYSWDLANFVAWAKVRRVQFYGNHGHDWYEKTIKEIAAYEPHYKELASLENAPADSIIYYVVKHKYSLYNPAFKNRFDFTDSVTITPANVVLSSKGSVDIAKAMNKLFN